MRRSFFLVALACCLGGVVAMQAADSGMRASKPDVKKAVVAVIEEQLVAFRKGETDKAYSFSSQRLQRRNSLRTFLAIVKSGYPEIWTNISAEYGIVRDDGETATVLVHVKGKQGEASYDYRLDKERVGWRIAGVVPHEARPGERL
jgi:hypothetical protein